MGNYWNALLTMSAEMAPYLLLGFFIAGLLRVFMPKTLYSKHLAPRNMKSVVKAAALGVPLPLCSCGVIPTAVGLRKEGASHGACTSFLIATPQTGVDSIIATYSLMGLPFAVVRPLAALFTALEEGSEMLLAIFALLAILQAHAIYSPDAPDASFADL